MPTLRKRPICIIIRDGWGHNPYGEWDKANAVHLANTPVDDRLRAEYPWVQIHTSGLDVGLPPGIMGNSEVGHQNIGAGRIVDQEIVRISKQIESGELAQNPVIQEALQRVKDGSGKLHLMGLASEAGVHSSLEHLYGLLKIAKGSGVPPEKVFLHNFTDGRDTPPQSGIDFCREIEAKCEELGIGRVATVIGRYYAMDRDNRWDRVEKAYRLLTEATGLKVGSAIEAYETYYANPTEESRKGDEFIEPSVVTGADGQPLATIESGDSILFYNFRGDRPRELCRAFCADPFPYEAKDKQGNVRRMGFERPKLDTFFVTMTAYEQGLPVHVAIQKPPKMDDVLGDYVSKLGLKQFRCAETEKFPHVTFFFNDYREPPFEGEDRQIVPSPQEVTTYDQKPEMSAHGVTEAMLAKIAEDQTDLYILNYANGDMVGHTGNLQAAIRAVEAVDECVGKVVDAILAKGGALIVTADHGNCEQMVHPQTGGPHTAHTTYDVDLIVVDDGLTDIALNADGRLADIAPTALELLGLPQPEAMTGKSLLPQG